VTCPIGENWLARPGTRGRPPPGGWYGVAGRYVAPLSRDHLAPSACPTSSPATSAVTRPDVRVCRAGGYLRQGLWVPRSLDGADSRRAGLRSADHHHGESETRSTWCPRTPHSCSPTGTARCDWRRSRAITSRPAVRPAPRGEPRCPPSRGRHRAQHPGGHVVNLPSLWPVGQPGPEG